MKHLFGWNLPPGVNDIDTPTRCEHCNAICKDDSTFRCIACQGYFCSQHCLTEHNLMMYDSPNHEYPE